MTCPYLKLQYGPNLISIRHLAVEIWTILWSSKTKKNIRVCHLFKACNSKSVFPTSYSFPWSCQIYHACWRNTGTSVVVIWYQYQNFPNLSGSDLLNIFHQFFLTRHFSSTSLKIELLLPVIWNMYGVYEQVASWDFMSMMQNPWRYCSFVISRR